MKQITNLKEAIDNEGTSIVKFGADWCQPCKQLDPILQEVSEEMKYVSVYKVDINDVAKEATELGVRTVPVTIKFVDGKPVDRKIGLGTKEDYKEWVKCND